MTTAVINLKGRIRKYGPRLEHAPTGLVYVGRALTMGGWRLHAHPLHNPHTLSSHGTPEGAVAAYCRHLLDNPTLIDEIPALRGKTLACWCAPRLCHAHVLALHADHPAEGWIARYAESCALAHQLVETALFNRLAD